MTDGVPVRIAIGIPVEFILRFRDMLAEQCSGRDPAERAREIPLPPEWRRAADEVIGRPLADEGGSPIADDFGSSVTALARRDDRTGAPTTAEQDIVNDALGESAKSGFHSAVRARAVNELSDLSKPWEYRDSDGWRRGPLVPL